MAPFVSIVILNWNGRHYLERFLPSIFASDYPNFRVVVADNCSTDDSIPFLRSYYPEVEIIELKRNYGFAGGYNQALRLIKSDYYVLLNSDVEVTPGWIGPVIELMERDPLIGACQPRLLQFDRKDTFEYSGAAGGWLDALGYPFARGRVFDHLEKDRGQYDQSVPVFWASGAVMFVRPDIFFQAGGFDELFFAHQEEIDLCWRMQKRGYSVWCCGESLVYHVGGGTLPKGNSRKVFLNFRNNLIMLAKNMTGRELLWKLPLRFVLDMISAFKSLLMGEGRYFMAVVRAHIAFWKWLSGPERDRWKYRGITKKREGYFSGSLVWQHFVRGRKIFSEIVHDSGGFLK